MATSTTKRRPKSSKATSKPASTNVPRRRVAQRSDLEADVSRSTKASRTKARVQTNQSAGDGSAAKQAKLKRAKAAKAKDRAGAAKNATTSADTSLAADPTPAHDHTDNAAEPVAAKANAKAKAKVKEKVSAPSAAPKGKLAALLEAISKDGGASLAEISAALGWQHHTTRAAITRLRQRGYDIVLEGAHGARCYQLRAAA